MKIVLLRVCDCVLCVMAITSSYYGACHRILCTYILIHTYIYIYKQFHCYNLLYHFGYNVQLQCDKEIEMPCYFTFANNCDFKCIHYEPNSTDIHTHTHRNIHEYCTCMYGWKETQFSGSGSENGSQTVNRHQISFGSRHQDVVKHFVYGCMWYIFWLM